MQHGNPHTIQQDFQDWLQRNNYWDVSPQPLTILTLLLQISTRSNNLNDIFQGQSFTEGEALLDEPKNWRQLLDANFVMEGIHSLMQCS